MANLVITTSGNSVLIDFGVYASLDQIDGRMASYKIDDISVVWMEKDDSFVNVKMKDAVTATHWKVSYDGASSTFIIDSIDGVAPTDNIDLFNKITAIRG